MPTYRVMDSDGVIVDEGRKPTDINSEEILTWYKNMLTGKRLLHTSEVCIMWAYFGAAFAVSIMDLIMFDAQRQGRLSFYMVRARHDFELSPTY